MPNRPHGFTLIELLIALVVVAILAAIAVPSYESSVLRARRDDARQTLMLLVQSQERLRANCPQYADKLGASDDCSTSTVGAANRSAAGHYEVRLLSADATGFRAQAQALGRQGRDSACATLELTLSAGNLTTSPGQCW